MKLNIEKRSLIQKLILQRIEADRAIGIPDMQLNIFRNVIEKLGKDTFSLNKNEAITMANFTKTIISKFYQEFKIKNSSFWIEVPLVIKKRMEEKDVLLDLLSEVNPNFINDIFLYRLDFRSRHVIETIENMRTSNQILLSSIANPYKMAFVNGQTDYNAFALKNKIKIEDYPFFKIQNWDILVNSFNNIISREKASKVISTLDSKIYPQENIDFLLKVLE